MNTENKQNILAPARVPELHFAQLLHDGDLAIRSQHRREDDVIREVQARLAFALNEKTVLTMHEAPMALAAVDTYLAALAAHRAEVQRRREKADADHADRIAAWERDCTLIRESEGNTAELPPRPPHFQPTLPKEPKAHEHKVRAHSIEPPKDEERYIRLEVIGVDSADGSRYRMGRLDLRIHGCPVIRVVADSMKLVVVVRSKLNEQQWALLEATQREIGIEAVSPYIDVDGSGQLVWNEVLDTVPALRVVADEASQNVVQFGARDAAGSAEEQPEPNA